MRLYRQRRKRIRTECVCGSRSSTGPPRWADIPVSVVVSRIVASQKLTFHGIARDAVRLWMDLFESWTFPSLPSLPGNPVRPPDVQTFHIPQRSTQSEGASHDSVHASPLNNSSLLSVKKLDNSAAKLKFFLVELQPTSFVRTNTCFPAAWRFNSWACCPGHSIATVLPVLTTLWVAPAHPGARVQCGGASCLYQWILPVSSCENLLQIAWRVQALQHCGVQFSFKPFIFCGHLRGTLRPSTVHLPLLLLLKLFVRVLPTAVNFSAATHLVQNGVRPECSTLFCTLHCSSTRGQFHASPNGVGAGLATTRVTLNIATLNVVVARRIRP